MTKQSTRRIRRVRREQHAQCPKLTVFDPRPISEGECYCMFKKFKNNRNNHAINIDYDEPEDHIAEECPCIEKNKKLREKYLNKYEPTSSNVDQISHNEIPEAPATSNLD